MANHVSFSSFSDVGGVMQRDWRSGLPVSGVSHPGFGIELMHEGSGRVLTNGRTYDVGPGVYLTEPNQVVAVQRRQADVTRSTTFWIPESNLMQMTEVLGLIGTHTFRGYQCNDPRVEAQLKKTFARRHVADVVDLIDVLVETGWLRALRGEEEEPTMKMVERVRQHLRERFLENVSLDELAEFVGGSKFTMLRAFKAQYGLPPHAFVVNLRVTRARELLAQGFLASAVAPMTGFHDQAHLTRHFKRIVGQTPRQYQRSLGVESRQRATART